MTFQEAWNLWDQNGQEGPEPTPNNYPGMTTAAPLTGAALAAEQAWKQSYQQWLAAGAQGSPPQRPDPNQALLDAQRQQAVDQAQSSGFGGNYDLTGTNANAGTAGGNPLSFNALTGANQTSTVPSISGQAVVIPTNIGHDQQSSVSEPTSPVAGALPGGQSFINLLQGGGGATPSTTNNINWSAYLQNNPDVNAWAQDAVRAGQFPDVNAAAASHYDTWGRAEGRQVTNLGTSNGGNSGGGIYGPPNPQNGPAPGAGATPATFNTGTTTQPPVQPPVQPPGQPPTQPPTTPQKTPNPATGRPWTFAELQQKYADTHPGGSTATGAAFGDEFNQWAGTIVGPNGWDDSAPWSGWAGYLAGSGMDTSGGVNSGTDNSTTAGNNFRQSQTGAQAGSYDSRNTTNVNNQQTTGQNTTNEQATTGFNNLTSGGTNQSSTQGTNQQATTQNQQTTNQQNTQNQQQTNQTQNTTNQQQTQQNQQLQNQQNTTNQQTNQQTGNIQNTGSQTTQNTTGTQGIAATTGQRATQGEASNVGVSQTGVTDTLGFGGLLQGQAGQAQANDTARTRYLTDLVNTGGQNVNSQIDQAVRQSLTGPQTTGAGESARARMGAYAAAQIARQNTGERLNAAQQLAGPTAVTQLAGAGTPFLGQVTANAQRQSTAGQEATAGTEQTAGQQTSTGQQTSQNNQIQNILNSMTGSQNTTGSQSMTGGSTTQGSTGMTGTQNQIGSGSTSGTTGMTGTSNTTGANSQNTTGSNTGFQNQSSGQNTSGTTGMTGFNNLVGTQSEVGSGSALGSSRQNASGLIPQSQAVQTGGGGCIICTAGLHHGLWRRPRLLRKVVRHKLVVEQSRFAHAARGYFFLFGPIASLALRSRLVSRLTMPIANAVVYEEARVAGVGLPLRRVPWAIHWAWHGLCALAGHLPVRNDVADKAIVAVAKKHNVLFNVGV